MDKFDRIQQLHRLLRSHRRPIPAKHLAERMECSEKTVKRMMETMRLHLDAPIEYQRSQRGYFYDDTETDRFELPGLWLTANELQSLSLLLNLLQNIGPGLLNTELGPIEKEVDKLLSVRGIPSNAFKERIRVLPMGNQQIPSRHFEAISTALLQDKQIDISYKSYTSNQTQRRISPQTLVHYRENWYLDAWCHLRNSLRTFHLSRITSCKSSKAKRKAVDQAQLSEHFTKSYGIFAGKAKHTAKLRFDFNIAREIALQQWHPEQVGQWDGSDFLLLLPYSDDRELIQDILKHSPNVFVEAPAILRSKVQGKLQDALGRYAGRRIQI